MPALSPPSVGLPQLLYVHPASPQLPPPSPPSPPRRASLASTISNTLTSHLGHGPWEDSPELRERQHQQQRQQMQQLQLHMQVQQQRLESQQRRLIEELKFPPGEGKGAGQSGTGGSRQRPLQGRRGFRPGVGEGVGHLGSASLGQRPLQGRRGFRLEEGKGTGRRGRHRAKRNARGSRVAEVRGSNPHKVGNGEGKECGEEKKHRCKYRQLKPRHESELRMCGVQH